MKSVIGLIFLFLVLVTLNPSKDDYESYCNKLIGQIASIPNDQLADAIKKISVSIFISDTERTNFYLFSIFKTKIESHEIIRYGILSFFIDSTIFRSTTFLLITLVLLAILGIAILFHGVGLFNISESYSKEKND